MGVPIGGLQWGARSIRFCYGWAGRPLGSILTPLYNCKQITFIYVLYITNNTIIARGPELSIATRACIYKLCSISWSYKKIYTKYPNIPLLIIGNTYRTEATRLNCQSKVQTGVPRVILEDEHNALFKAIQLTPEIIYEALQAQEALNASVRLIKRLFQKMNIRKWIRLK
jgi:hypothetical protein